MSKNIIQPSFSAGEVSPWLYGRVDTAKYHVGAALMENFFADYRGGASTRQGTMFSAEVGDSTHDVQLIPFVFNLNQNFMLEFGHLYIRFFYQGFPVLQPALTLTAVTKAFVGVFTIPAHGYGVGDTIFISSPTSMTEINGGTFKIGTVIDGNNFTLVNLRGAAVNTTGYSTYTTGGTTGRVAQVPTPYQSDDLKTIKWAQSADVLTLTHVNYPQMDLQRFNNYTWTLTQIPFGSLAIAPTGLTATANPATAGTSEYAYCVTSIDANGQESVASAIAKASLAVDINKVACSIALAWTAVPGAASYRVYKANYVTYGGIPAGVSFGFMGATTLPTFVDSNIIPDFTSTPPIFNNPFAGGNYPAAVAYFQQRKVYAGTQNFPQNFYMSKPGQFNNFSKSNPIRPDDPISGTLVSQEVNRIKYMIAMPGGLVTLTSGGAWQISGGGANAPVSPASLTATPQAYNGAADVQPIIINYDILYVQQLGNIVRDLSYNFYTNIYTGEDISVLSSHLFVSYTIDRWAYAEDPYKVIWAVRNDGTLLGLTYLKEQQITGWSRHTTNGLFRSVAMIQENNTSSVYFVVERTILGVVKKFIERLASRIMPYGSEDAWFVDAGLATAGDYRVGILTATYLTPTTMQLIDSAASFTTADIGRVVRVGKGVIEITTLLSGYIVNGNIIRPPSVLTPQEANPLPQIAPSRGWSVWTKVSTITGLFHLEGKLVSILGDGNVYQQQVVTNGAVSINQPASKIVVGLPYTAKLQTLNLDTGEPTVQGKRKKIAALNIRVTETRGLQAGSDFNNLVPFKERGYQLMGVPIELITGDERVVMNTNWTVSGQICLQQTDPLPATVLAVIPEIVIGDT